MRVMFANLEELVEELKDRLIHEVRVEVLHDTQTLRGLTQARLYVSVEALLEKELIATFERTTFSGLWPMEDDKRQERQEVNRAHAEAIRHELSHTFKVRHGHYVEAVEAKERS